MRYNWTVQDVLSLDIASLSSGIATSETNSKPSTRSLSFVEFDAAYWTTMENYRMVPETLI
jgi:hypothetical protein